MRYGWQICWKGNAVGLSNETLYWCNAFNGLSSDELVTSLHCITKSHFNWRQTSGGSKFVHLSFMCKAGLYDTEAAHCATRRVIGAHCITINNRVWTNVWPLRVSDAIDENSCRCGCISATIKNETSFNLDDSPVVVGVMPHPYLCRVTMNVSKETFLTSVLHLYWSTCAKGKQCSVNLKTDVFACTKRSADAAED